MFEYFPSSLFVEPRRADGRAARRRADRDRRRVPAAAGARRAAGRQGRSGRAGGVDRGLGRARAARRGLRGARRGRRPSLVGGPQVPARLRLLVHRRAHGEPQVAATSSSCYARDDARASRRASRCATSRSSSSRIPYEGTTLPALLYRAPQPGPRPAMIHFDGFDVTKEWMHLCGIAHEFARARHLDADGRPSRRRRGAAPAGPADESRQRALGARGDGLARAAQPTSMRRASASSR